jgi:hypothetical protein
MAAGAARVGAAISWPQRGGRRRLAAVVVVACLATAYLIGLVSTRAAVAGGAVNWSGPVSGKGAGLASMTPAQGARSGMSAQGYSNVLWASRPGGEVFFGFELRNRGLVPVTIVGLALRRFDPGVINALAPAGALIESGRSGSMAPFHPVTLGPGASVSVGLVERIICQQTLRRDARLPGHRGDHSYLGDATSPVVVHYQALGVTMSQTVSLQTPVLVVLPYRSCR